MAERLNSTIKNELFKDIKFHSIEEVKRAMAKAVEFYNNERPHMSLDNMTPHQAASYKGKLIKMDQLQRKVPAKFGVSSRSH